METDPNYPRDAFRLVQKQLSGKWKLIILWKLSKGTMRFSALHRELETITESTLAQQLKQLEEDDLICRRSYNEIPPRVEYSLSQKGRTLIPLLRETERWALQQLKDHNH
ncbi:MAG: helix-turn-helix domain-containing protein [Anaerolineaceae bacterium]